MKSVGMSILLSLGFISNVAAVELGDLDVVTQSYTANLKGAASVSLFNKLKNFAECQDIQNGNGTSHRLCTIEFVWDSGSPSHPFSTTGQRVGIRCGQVNQMTPECILTMSN